MTRPAQPPFKNLMTAQNTSSDDDPATAMADGASAGDTGSAMAGPADATRPAVMAATRVNFFIGYTVL